MRGYRNYSPNTSYASMPERIFSGLSCLTYGLVGFVWIIISHIRNRSLSSFARFHIFQSIFVFISIYVASIIFNILFGFVQIMPFIGSFFVDLKYFLTGYPLIFGMSMTSFLVQGLAIYMAVFAFRGKYAELPWFSDTVRRML